MGFFYTFLICLLSFTHCLVSDSYEEVPILYKGRFRPIEAYARLELVPLDHLWQSHIEGLQYNHEQDYVKQYEAFIKNGLEPKEIQKQLEREFPLANRLRAIKGALTLLPAIYGNGEWFPLEILRLHIYQPENNKLILMPNVTMYSDATYKRIQQAYIDLEKVSLEKNPKSLNEVYKLTDILQEAYKEIEGKIYKVANQKSLVYPSTLQLKFESWYYHYPLIKIVIFLYCLAAIILILNRKAQSLRFDKVAIGLFILAFAAHSLILGMRSFILGRPPVSNMFETVVYVPWIAVIIGLVLYFVWKERFILIASAISAIGLLIVLQLTGLNESMENVQAVLDSQFWLIIHVLMIVGSYGVFILGGILAHFYLVKALKNGGESSQAKALSSIILQCLYTGTVLLISGTMLGGVWAAESWGRFWDWDPKEAWAFITSCIYLILIHAFRFKKIGDQGLAFGSIVGLLAVSFTWYGVNYILGTGLHSYGFGSGGEMYYYAYVLGECFFLLGCKTALHLYRT